MRKIVIKSQYDQKTLEEFEKIYDTLVVDFDKHQKEIQRDRYGKGFKGKIQIPGWINVNFEGYWADTGVFDINLYFTFEPNFFKGRDENFDLWYEIAYDALEDFIYEIEQWLEIEGEREDFYFPKDFKELVNNLNPENPTGFLNISYYF